MNVFFSNVCVCFSPFGFKAFIVLQEDKSDIVTVKKYRIFSLMKKPRLW